MVNFNIFRNPHIDAQVGYLIDSYQDGLRKQTERYWRETIAQEIRKHSQDMKNKIEIDENNIHHGEYILKYWVEYITEECERIARRGS